MNNLEKIKLAQFCGDRDGVSSWGKVDEKGVLSACVFPENTAEFVLWVNNLLLDDAEDDEDKPPHVVISNMIWRSECCDANPQNPNEPIEAGKYYMCGRCKEMAEFYPEERHARS